MEGSRLAEEEKVALLQLVIMSNAKSYEKQLLVKDTDYTVEYSNNTEPGTAIVTITAVENGNFTGTKEDNFKRF